MLKFLLFVLLGLFLPGYILVRKISRKDLILSIFLSVSLGFVLLTLVSYLAGWLGLRWLPLLYVALSVVLFITKQYYLDFKKLQKFKISKYSFGIIVLIILGTVFQNSITFRSGAFYDFGIGFWGPTGHDGVWHQALVNELIKNFPPNNPTFSGMKLTNYHYFYDLLVAETVRLTNLSVLDLIYRFYSILFSLLLGMGTYLVSSKLFKQKLSILIAVFLVYFGSSFGWVIEWIKERHLGGESAFWVNQPVSMNINPPFAISLILVIAAILLYQKYSQTRDQWTAILLAIIAGSIIEFKAYGGLIVLGALFCVSMIEIIKKRDFGLLKVFSLALIVAATVFLPQNSGAGNLLVFFPFWFIHSMIDFGDRVGWLRLSQARMAYFQEDKWAKFIAAEVLGFSIFIIGNLGTRIIAFFSLLRVKIKKIKSDHLLIFLMALISFIASLLFVQKGNPWNTIQFMYYFLFFVALYAGHGLALLKEKIKNPYYILFTTCYLVITPISSFATFRSGLGTTPPAVLPLQESKALDFLKEQKDGIVLTYPYDKNLRPRFKAPYPLLVYETTAYVSAFSSKEVFLEDIIQQEIFQNSFNKRLEDSSKFFFEADLEWSENFLKENNISYIYLPKIYFLPAAEEEFPMTKIFENNQVNIYEVVK